MLAISRTGIRLIGFRSDVSLDPDQPPSGSLYAARSNRGGPWVIEPIDADGFGESVAFDRQGHPAIAYLARTGVGDQAEVRLARLLGGQWQIEHLEMTTYREAPAAPTRPRSVSRSTTRAAVRRVRRLGVALGAADHPGQAERADRRRARRGGARGRLVRAEPRGCRRGLEPRRRQRAAAHAVPARERCLARRPDRRVRLECSARSSRSRARRPVIAYRDPRGRRARPAVVRRHLRVRDGAPAGGASELARLGLARCGARARRRGRGARVAARAARVLLEPAPVTAGAGSGRSRRIPVERMKSSRPTPFGRTM